MGPIRPFSPGEGHKASLGFRDESLFYSRPFIGQIISIDEDNGTAEVIALQLGAPVTLHLPFPGISINRNESSWIRYMPQKGDFVILVYGVDNKPEIVSYTLHGDNPQADAKSGQYVTRTGGYKTVRLLKERSDTGEKINNQDNRGVATSIPLGFREFIPLKSGEWDMRSKGGAGLHGSRFGILNLYGGPNFLRIDKTREEIVARAAMFHLDAQGDSFIRLGDVKRKLTPVSPTESVVTGAGKELHLRISKNIGTAQAPIYVKSYDLRAGDVRDDDTLGLIPLVPPAVLDERVFSPLPTNITLYERKVEETGALTETLKSSSGLQLHKRSVDAAGNAEIQATAGLNFVVGPAGTPTLEPIIRGNALAFWLTTQLSVLTAFGPSGPAVTPPPGTTPTPGNVGHSSAKIT